MDWLEKIGIILTFSTEYSDAGISRQIVNLTWTEDGVIQAPRGRKVKLTFNKLDLNQIISVSEVRERDVVPNERDYDRDGLPILVPQQASQLIVRQDYIMG